jgi:hypothetical protein
MSFEIVLSQKRFAMHIAALVWAPPSFCYCNSMNIDRVSREVCLEEESGRTHVAFEAPDVFEIDMLSKNLAHTYTG